MWIGQEEQRWCWNPLHPCSTYETPQTHKQERGKPTEEEEVEERENMKDGKIQLTRKEPAVAVTMDNWSEGVGKILGKLPRQPSHALVISACESHVVVPRHQWALLFFFPPTTLGVDSFWSWSLRKNNHQEIVCPFPTLMCRLPQPRKQGARMWHVFPQHPPPPWMLNRHLQTAFCLDQWSVWLYQAPWLCPRFKDIT